MQTATKKIIHNQKPVYLDRTKRYNQQDIKKNTMNDVKALALPRGK